MSIDNEIERAVLRIAALNKNSENKTSAEQEQIFSDVKEAFRNSDYDFTKVTSITLNQGQKNRLVKHFSGVYSVENVLCQCIKQILDKTFKIKYPNRNAISHNLFCTLSATIKMSDFTIVKFDFKDYFNSVSSVYVFEKFLKKHLLNRHERDLVYRFMDDTKYAYAGLCTSNAIAEIIARSFDSVLKKAFYSYGMIYYERYIDDCILILNEHVEESEIKDILSSSLKCIYHDSNFTCRQCKTEFNDSKFRYVSRRCLTSMPQPIDFLGYSFYLSQDTNKVSIQYGITAEKRDKYCARLDSFIRAYTDPLSSDYKNIELLRHKIAAFSSREVYLTKRYNSTVWRVKGFISNYGELRYLLPAGKIEPATTNFLKNAIDEAFDRAGIKKPYFINSGSPQNNGYNLYSNMSSNKTILLVDHIGYDYTALVSLCKQIGIENIDAHGRRRNYSSLVRDYLIKVRVGY